MYPWFSYYTWCLLKIVSHVRVCCKTNRSINCWCITHTSTQITNEKMKCAHKLEVEIAELVESSELIINELNWFALSQDVHFDEKAYEDLLRDVQDDVEGKEQFIGG